MFQVVALISPAHDNIVDKVKEICKSEQVNVDVGAYQISPGHFGKQQLEITLYSQNMTNLHNFLNVMSQVVDSCIFQHYNYVL